MSGAWSTNVRNLLDQSEARNRKEYSEQQNIINRLISKQITYRP